MAPPPPTAERPRARKVHPVLEVPGEGAERWPRQELGEDRQDPGVGCVHTEDLSGRKGGQVGLRGPGNRRARAGPFALARGVSGTTENSMKGEGAGRMLEVTKGLKYC